MAILLSQLSEPGNGRQDPLWGALVGSDVVILAQNCSKTLCLLVMVIMSGSVCFFMSSGTEEAPL